MTQSCVKLIALDMFDYRPIWVTFMVGSFVSVAVCCRTWKLRNAHVIINVLINKNQKNVFFSFAFIPIWFNNIIFNKYLTSCPEFECLTLRRGNKYVGKYLCIYLATIAVTDVLLYFRLCIIFSDTNILLRSNCL